MPVDGQFNPITEEDLITGYEYTTSDDDTGVTNTVTFNEDFEVVGEAFDDGEGNTFSQQTTTNDDGSYTVTTTSTSADTEVSSTFNYDSTGELIDGEETVNGKTVRYSGPTFTVIAETTVIDTDTAAFESIVVDESTNPTQFKDFLNNLADEVDVYMETEGDLATVGDSRTQTFYSRNDEYSTADVIAGDILGYKLTVKTAEITENDVTEDIYETEFFDANWNKLGSIEQGYIDASSLTTFRDISFTQEVLEDGVVIGYVETGSYQSYDETGTTSESEYEYNFDNEDNFLSGSETFDNVETTFGANWEELGSTFSSAALADLTPLTEAELKKLPSALKSADDGNEDTVEHTYAVLDEVSGQTTYFNNLGKILGYSDTYDYGWDETYGSDTVTIEGTSTNYNDANWNWLGSSWSDVYGEGYNSNVVIDGERIEAGSFTSYRVTNGVRDGEEDAPEIIDQSSYEYRFDEATGQMLGGSETRGATTTTYGADWQVVSTVTTVDTTSGNFTQLTSDDLDAFPSAFITAIGVADSDGNYTAEVWSSSQDLGWGEETTYYSVTDSGSSLLGYSMQEEFDTDLDVEGAEEQYTAYFDTDHEWVGNEYANEYGSGSYFRIDVRDDSGEVLYQLESGIEFGEDDRDSPIREWEFRFDPETGDMLGGTETMDGRTIEYGANWERLSESVSIEEDELARLELSADDLVGIPSTLQGETVTYARVEDYEGGSETTYFTSVDGKLQILGYSNTHEYGWEETYGDGEDATTVEIDGTSTNYSDADWNWLGSSWDDTYGEGYNSNVVVDGVRIETGNFTNYKVSEGRREVDENGVDIVTETTSYVYQFDEATGQMLGGSETRGATTTTYGVDWQVVSTVTTVDTTSGNFTQLTSDDLDAFPSAFITAIGVADSDGNYTAEVWSSSQDLGWGEETTYYSVTDSGSSLLGYSMVEGDEREGEDQYTSYFDTDHEWVGNEYANEYGSGSYFRIDVKDDSGEVLYQLESGIEFGEDDREPPIREWEFRFDPETGDMLGGTETMDGKTIEYGANWERLSESVSIEEDELARLELSADDLVGIPSTLQGETVTYARVEDYEGGSETTYFTSVDGKLQILGYSNTHEYGWEETYGDGEDATTVEIDGTSTNYSDADWNWLGSSWDDTYGEGYNSNVVVDGVRIETGNFTNYKVSEGRREVDENGVDIVTETTSYVYQFDEATGQMLGGSETRGATTTTYGVDWQVVSTVTTVDTTSGNFTQLTSDDLDAFPSAFITAIGVADSDGNYTAEVWSSSQDLGWGEETTYYSVTDSGSSLLGYSMVEGDEREGEDQYTSYFDTDHEWVGNEYANEYGSGSYFRIDVKDDSGEVLYQLESGIEFGEDDREPPIREWEFRFDPETGDMLGGTETMDGKTIEYGANWERLSESVSIEEDELARLELSADDLVGIPSTLQGETATYARVEDYETTYFTSVDGKLQILGYSNTHDYTTEDSDGVDQPGSSTNYNDANWNWLGSSWEDYYGSGYNSIVVEDGVRIDSGNFVSYAFDSEGVRVEVDGSPKISEQSSYEFRFDVETGEMLGGTQVNGPTTITYGANFEIESSVTEIDTTGDDFELVDGSELPAAFIDSLDLPEGDEVYSSSNDMGWGIETTYYSVGAEGSSLLGYSTSEGSEEETFTSYYDTEYMWVGNVNEDDDGSYSNFNLEVDGERLEISEQRDAEGNVVNSRSFRFDSETGDMLGGTEVSAGKIVEYGANHTKLSESLSLTLGDGEVIEDYLVGEDELDGIPQTLQGETATYAITQNYDMGSETTYFTIDGDGNNQILGYANLMSMDGEHGEDSYGEHGEDSYGEDGEDSYGEDGEDSYGEDGEDSYGEDGEDSYGEDGEDSYGEDGEDGGDEEGDDDDASAESTPSFFRVDYNDADWNYLGSSYSDEYGNGYNFNEVINGVRYEKGSESLYKFDNEDDVVVDEESGEPIISHASSYEYRFDVETGEMLGGTQVNGPTTITYGANFEIESSVTEIDTTGGDFTLVDGSGLPAAFIDSLDLPEGDEVYSSSSDMGWAVETTYYSVGAGGSSLLGYSTSEGSEDETFTSYYDTEYMWIGNVNEDDDGSYSNFNLEVDGERLEISEQRDAEGNVVNSRSFRFDAETGEMLGGTEVSAGKIVEYGANHTKLSESLSLTLGKGEVIEDYLVEEADLAEIPPVLQGSAGNTYSQTTESDYGSATTFFTIDDDGNYQILGYAETETFEGEDFDGEHGEDSYSEHGEDSYGEDGEDSYGEDGEDSYGEDGEDSYGEDGEDSYGEDGEDSYGEDGEDSYGEDGGDSEAPSPIAVIEEGGSDSEDSASFYQTTYFDLEYNWLGESYVDEYGSGFNHNYEAVIDGELSSVSHSYSDSEEQGIHEEYTVYNLEGQMVSGYQVDGPVRITYGPDWVETAREVDTTAFEPAALSSGITFIAGSLNQTDLESPTSDRFDHREIMLVGDAKIEEFHYEYDSDGLGPFNWEHFYLEFSDGSRTNLNIEDGSAFVEVGALESGVMLAELNDAGVALIASREVVGFTIEAGFTDADDVFSVSPTVVTISNDTTGNSITEQTEILSASVDVPNSLLDDFVSAYFGDVTLLQDVEYDNEDFGHYITYYNESGVELATSHKMIMGDSAAELRINESGGDDEYGDKLIYEARSGDVESVERYSIENDDGTITETEVREQTFDDGDDEVTNIVSSTFTYQVDEYGNRGEIISGTETRDGVTTTFGAGMIELSKSLSLTLGEGEVIEDYLVEEADLAEIPPVLQGSAGNTYSQTTESDYGSATTFFTIDDDGNYQILGYAETETFEGEDFDGEHGEDSYSEHGEDSYGEDGEDSYGEDGEDSYGEDGEDSYGEDGEDSYGEDGEDSYGEDGEDYR